MRSMMLFAAGLMVGLAVQVGVAQSGSKGVVMMNHVGINVPNIPEAMTYYTQKMGYRKRSGSTTTRDSRRSSTCRSARTRSSSSTRRAPSGAPGFTHYGLHVENAAAAVKMFKDRGVTVTDTNVSAGTKAILANITDPYMGRIELVEITPESTHQKAIQSWK